MKMRVPGQERGGDDDMDEENTLKSISEIIAQAAERKASDIHLVPDARILLRVDGTLVPLSEERLAPSVIEQQLSMLLTEAQRERLGRTGELVFVYTAPDNCRVRIGVYRQRGNYAMTLRLLPMEIPEPQKLGLPESLVALTRRQRGLVLVAGEAGSGRTTTLASLTAAAAHVAARTIITLGSPIEYQHPQGSSLILQREIGSDSASYEAALRMTQWQDVDVIEVGELRGQEEIEAALDAAEGGHLVLAGLAVDSMAAAIERMTAGTSTQRQQRLRVQLSEVFAGIVTQRLLPRQASERMPDATGRVAAFELLLADAASRRMIRTGSIEQLPSVLETGREVGMQSMDDAIYDLYMKSDISTDTAIAYAHDPEEMRQKLQLF